MAGDPVLRVTNARLYPTPRHGSQTYDLVIEGNRFRSLVPSGSRAVRVTGEALEIDADGRLLSPPLVDPHVHLDCVLSVGEPRHNQTGTLLEAIQIWSDHKPTLTVAGVKARARQVIGWEVAQGTGFIRSHVDVCDPNLTAVRALLELREEVRDLVDLQLIAFPQDGILSFPDGKALMREAMHLGVDVVGGIPHYEWTREDGIEEVRFVFDLAEELSAPVDLHCDETDDEQSRFLEHVAAQTMRRTMQGRVVAGHVTAMASYNDAYAFKLTQMLRRAGVTIVANPLDNIVLQGRFDTYPKRRGMTRVKELDAAGINVACGHDSVMDPCYPLGRGSMLDALSMLVHVAQMTGRDELFRAYDMVTTNAARGAGRSNAIEEGACANFVIFDCEDEVDAIRLRPAARHVVHEGRLVAETKPAQGRIFPGDNEELVAFAPIKMTHQGGGNHDEQPL
jgi:cytosine/creatinine deaminase